MERLQKYLARAGVASRRHCEELIATGKVKVNGVPVTELGVKVNPLKDSVSVEGRRIVPMGQRVYMKMYKPRGYVTTMSDPRGRKTINDLLKDIPERIYPVGRLDYDSEGLLLLTNDGDLAFALSHPRHRIPKTYMVRVEGIPAPSKLQQLMSGIPLEEGLTAPAQVEMVDIFNSNALLRITLNEGKNRQIRRMCEYIGHPVKRLKRASVGPISLGEMKSGECVNLSVNELRLLKRHISGNNDKKTKGTGHKGKVHNKRKDV